MRRILVCSLVFMALALTTVTCFSQEAKIAYVDILKVLEKYQKTEDYEKNLEAKGKKAEQDLETKRAEIETLNNSLSIVKEKERAKKTEELKEKFAALQKLEQNLKVELNKERNDMMKELYEDIKKVVSDYSKKNSLSLVIDQNAIHYADAAMDITEKILNISNQGYKKSKK